MCNTLFGWLGGKKRLAKTIIKLIPEHTCYCEPFAGALNVLFRKEKSDIEVINDINKDVVTFYRVVQNHSDEFTRCCLQLPAAHRDEFNRFVSTNPEYLTDIQRAVRFFYIVKNCYGCKIGSVPSFRVQKKGVRIPSVNANTIAKNINAAKNRLATVWMECRSYADILPTYDSQDTFFYIDPPYFGCEKDYGTGIFSANDFLILKDMLLNIKGKFLMSINDVQQIRDIFSDFYVTEANTKYTIKSSDNNMEKTELLYSNYVLPKTND